MKGKGYTWGLLFAAAWLALLLALLYAVASFTDAPPNLRLFCLCWLAGGPPLCGFAGGWRQGRAGFAFGLRAMALPLLLIIAAWWWALPPLWDSWLAVQCALYALATGVLAAGLGAGFKAAQQKLYPPPPPPEEAQTD